MAGNADRAVPVYFRRFSAGIWTTRAPLGQRDLRRLLFTGAMTVVRHASRRGEITDPWLAGMLARKPKKVVAVALANRTARMVWALTTRKRPTGFALPPDWAAKGEGAKVEKLPGDVGRRTQERVRANGRQDRIGKTSKWRRAYEPAYPIWIRSHEHHTGPRPTRAASRGRTYDST